MTKLKELSSISFGATKVSAQGMGMLAKLPKLYEVNLAGWMLTPQAVQVLEGISSLRALFSYALTDESLQKIRRLQQLESVTILEHNNTYSEKELDALIESLPLDQLPNLYRHRST